MLTLDKSFSIVVVMELLGRVMYLLSFVGIVCWDTKGAYLHVMKMRQVSHVTSVITLTKGAAKFRFFFTPAKVNC